VAVEQCAQVGVGAGGGDAVPSQGGGREVVEVPGDQGAGVSGDGRGDVVQVVGVEVGE